MVLVAVEALVVLLRQARVLVIEHVVQLLTVVHGRVRRIPFTDPPVSSISLASTRARGQIIDARNSQIVWFSERMAAAPA
jgi:hypothetical protein